MERKAISIDITPDTLDENREENAGVMWEHNAVSIIFNIDPRFVGNYRYYIEYRSFLGTLVRTAELTLNKKNNTITYAIPATMSSLMSVECFFNIVSVDGDGNTLQIIKPKRFCLDFDRAPDTDNTLAKINDFTINSLLEAIRNGAFKGEKGDKGDAYILTAEDRDDIALKINREIYGLPYIRAFEGSGKTLVIGVVSNGAVKNLSLRAATSDFSNASEAEPVSYTSLSKIKLFIGKNEIEYLLTPDMYSEFVPNPEVYDNSNYSVAQVTLKPNTNYALVRYDKNINDTYAGLSHADKMNFFIHKTSAQNCRDYIEFTTDKSGIVYLVGHGFNGHNSYAQFLRGCLYGLGIYELSKSEIISVELKNNMCSITDDNADTVELTSGRVIYYIEQFSVPSNFSDDAVTSFASGNTTVYRYKLPLTVTPDCRNDYDIVSTHYKQMNSFVDSDGDLSKLIASGGEHKGIYLDRENEDIYLYTDKDPYAFAEFVAVQQAAGIPVTVLYRMKYSYIELITPSKITLNKGPALTFNKKDEYIYGFPEKAVYSVSVNGDISDALNKILKKIEIFNCEEMIL